MKTHHIYWIAVGAVALLATGCGTVHATTAVGAHHPPKKSATPKTPALKTPPVSHRSKSVKVPSNYTATVVTLASGQQETVTSGPWPSWPASWDQPGKWSNGQTIPTVRGYAFGVPGTPAPQILPTVIPAGVSTHGLTAQVDQMGQIAARAVVSQYLGFV